MPVDNRPVTPPGKATDGVSVVPGNSLVKTIDWDRLKREFLFNETHPSINRWLREVKKWPAKKVKNGNTQQHITGWSKLRADTQQKIIDGAILSAKEQEKKLAPLLVKGKVELVKGLVKDLANWNKLTAYDKKIVYDILKVELGEPTNIKVQANIGDDPVRKLLEKFMVAKEGAILDVEPEDFPDSEEPPAADDGAPAGETQPKILQVPEQSVDQDNDSSDRQPPSDG